MWGSPYTLHSKPASPKKPQAGRSFSQSFEISAVIRGVIVQGKAGIMKETLSTHLQTPYKDSTGTPRSLYP